MNFITRAIKEACVDKAQAMLGCADTFLEVNRGAALFIHDTQFDRIWFQTQNALNMGENLVRKGNFLRPVHLGLHHIDRPCMAVAQTIRFLKVMHGDQCGDHRIHHALVSLAAIFEQNRRVGHQMTHIAHQHQSAAFHVKRAAIGRGKGFIGGQAAGHGLPALLKAFHQIALHQTKPIGIGQNLVLGIDTGHRIFAVHDSRNRRFQTDIRKQGLVTAANRMGAVKDQFNMQAIVAQKDGIRRLCIARIALELRRICEGLVIHHQLPLIHAIAADIGMACPLNGEAVIKEDPRARHNARSTTAIIAAFGGQAAHSIRAIKRIIETAPTRIGRVQGKSRIGDGHNQLWACHCGDLRVNAIRVDLEIFPLRQEIPDLTQKGLIGIAIMGLTTACNMPFINLTLQIFTLLQKGAVFVSFAMQKIREPRPKCISGHASANQGPSLDEIRQNLRHLQACTLYTFGHLRGLLSSCCTKAARVPSLALAKNQTRGKRSGKINRPIIKGR